MTDTATIERLDHLIWTLVAMVAAAVLVAPLVSNFYIQWPAFAAPMGACMTLAAAGWFYSRWRHDARLASALTSTAQVVAFAAVGAPLSYLAAASGAPLADHLFAGMDAAMGFDWKALLAWLNEWPWVFAVMRPIYLSLTLQMTTAVLCLAFSGHLVWLRVYTLAFFIAAIVTIAISAVLPAQGAWMHYGLTAAASPHVLPTSHTSWPVFDGLHDGSYRALVAIGSEGLITFPSLHAALAVIMMVAIWPIRRLRVAICALNAAMLAATPIDGSHYLIDVIAGIAVAVLALKTAHSLATWAASERTAVLPGKIAQPAAGPQ